MDSAAKAVPKHRTIDLVKNSHEVLRLERTRFKGYDLVNVRIWFRNENDELRPSPKGVTIRLEVLPKLIAALQVVCEDAGMLEAVPAARATIDAEGD